MQSYRCEKVEHEYDIWGLHYNGIRTYIKICKMYKCLHPLCSLVFFSLLARKWISRRSLLVNCYRESCVNNRRNAIFLSISVILSVREIYDLLVHSLLVSLNTLSSTENRLRLTLYVTNVRQYCEEQNCQTQSVYNASRFFNAR